LISRQRLAKFGSRSGSVQTACIGQHDYRIDRERVMLARLTKRIAQFVDMFRQQPQPSLRKIDGEEEAAPGDEIATIVCHAATRA
jgi:hypothetical protein